MVRPCIFGLIFSNLALKFVFLYPKLILFYINYSITGIIIGNIVLVIGRLGLTAFKGL